MAAEAGASMSFDALSGCIAKAKAKTPSHDELIEALKAFDHSGSGTIRTSDLKCDRAHPRPTSTCPHSLTVPSCLCRKILTEMTDEKLSSDQVDELIRDGDKYRTGEVSFDFFARMVSQF